LSSLSDWFYHFGALPALAISPAPVDRFLIKRLVNRRLTEQAQVSNEIFRSVQKVLPQLAKNSTNQIIQGVFETRIREDACVFEFPFWTPSNVDRKFRFSGLEHLVRAQDERKGAILLSAHIGALCSGLVALGLKGFPLNFLANNTPNDPSFPRATQKHAQLKMRGMVKTGKGKFILFEIGESMSTSTASRRILKELRSNEFVVILLDVSPRMSSNTGKAKFLGFDALFPTGFLRFAQSIKCPIIPFFTLRNTGKGPAHTVSIHEPAFTTGDADRDLQQFVSLLESVIRRNPDQWLPWEWLSHFIE
jgi:lauroyl/myristoyl acyltransferase